MISGQGLDRIGQGAQFGDFAPDVIAGVQPELLRVPYPGGGAHAYYVARFDCDELGDECQRFRWREDHLAGTGILLQLVVQVQLHSESRGIGDFVSRGDPGPHGTEGVEPLANQLVEEAVPFLHGLVVPEGQFARGDVVENRVANDGRLGFLYGKPAPGLAVVIGQFQFPVGEFC